VEQWQSGADHNVRLQNGTVQMLDLDATPQEGMIGAFRIVSKLEGETSTQRYRRIAKPLTNSMQE
jgi:hypothetical protein